MKAVAITGVGLVSPAGVGLTASLNRLQAGPLTPSSPPEAERPALPGPDILTIPGDFAPRRYLKRRKDLKLTARGNQLAVAAASLAVEDAGLADTPLDDVGTFFAVGREPGKLSDLVPALAHSRGPTDPLALGTLFTEGVRWMNPLWFLRTLPNMSLAHAAIKTEARGPSVALCSESDAGPKALREAILSIALGRTDRALAGGADARVAFMDRLAAHRLGQTEPAGEAGAIFFLETLEGAQTRNARIYGVLALSEEDTPLPSGVFGACGAAQAVADLALSVGRGQGWTGGGIRFVPREAPAAPALHLRHRPIPVAITAMGTASPLGHDLDTFSDALLAGHTAVRPITAFDATGLGAQNACEVLGFDPQTRLPSALFEAISGRDDRKSELALAAACDAIAAHGELATDCGIVFGAGLSSVSVAELLEDCAPYIDADGRYDYAAFGAAQPRQRPQAPLRHLVHRPIDLLRGHFGLSGPTACHTSACAASTAAVGHALDLIRRGEASMMIAGGADSMIHPFGMIPFVVWGAMTTEPDPARAGRPFEAERSGFVMGEGAAFFVLEPLESARAAGREPLALVHGWGSSCDAYNVTAPHPEGKGAIRAMSGALTDAGLAPEAVGYINAHGTGTPLNDVVEAAAIRRVFGANAPPVSSSKAQFGHVIAAAGAIELMACLAGFKGERLPPNAHLETPDPAIDLDLVGPKGRAGAVEYMLSNSFGFGGQNASLILGHPEATP